MFDESARNKRRKTAQSQVDSAKEKKQKDASKVSKLSEEFEEMKNNPEFLEFLKVQRNFNEKGKTWQNDDCLNVNSMVKGKKKAKKEKIKEQFIHTVKLKGIPIEKSKRRFIKDFLKPFKAISIRVPPKTKGIAYASFASEEEASKVMTKNGNFIDGSKISILKYQIKNSKSSSSKSSKFKKDGEKEIAEENVAEYGRIFIRNLSYTCTEENIENLFKKFGPLAEVHLPIDSYTKIIKGFGFVTFVFPEHAVKAFAELDGTIFQGRLLHLMPSDVAPDKKFESEEKSSFKKEKESEMKAKAGHSHNWNSLFLGINSTVDIMSENYNIEKSKLLLESNPKESIAVRIALGETQIVNKTRNFLLHHGVKLESFEHENPVRSKTILLVKHLPANTKQEELESLFSKYGVVERVLLPFRGVTAIVEMQNPAEARNAFKNLAYSKFKNIPLYLEWAPVDTFDESQVPLPAHPNPKKKDKQTGAKIIVRNIPFEAKVKDVRELFEAFGEIKAIRLPKKLTGTGTHRGFGFVEYVSKKIAKKAFDALSISTHLYGRRLALEWARVDKMEEEREAKAEHIEDDDVTEEKNEEKNKSEDATRDDFKKPNNDIDS